MNDGLKIVLFFICFCLIMTIGTMFEIWRWHTFQDVTHSNISFLKWLLMFGSK